MPWSQNYDPFGWWPLSTLVSALPVVTLFFVLLVLRRRVWVSALAGMVMAIGLALLVFRMPASLIAAASLNGFVFGFFRIAWIVIASIYLYNVAVETGQFQVMKESIAGLSSDRRLQVILIAFCFGAFLEGTGGGGAPVAIAGSFLIGLGFPHFQAATLCLLANTAPVAFGALGTPIIALAGVTGIDMLKLSAMVGRQLPVFSVIIPFWLVWAYAGFGGMLEVWPALITAGVAFAVPQFLISNYHGPWLAGIGASVVSIFALVGLLLVGRDRYELVEHAGRVLVRLLGPKEGVVQLLVVLLGLECRDLRVGEGLAELARGARSQDVAARQLGELRTGNRTLFLVGASLGHMQGAELAQRLSVGRAHLDVALERCDRLDAAVLALERGGEVTVALRVVGLFLDLVVGLVHARACVRGLGETLEDVAEPGSGDGPADVEDHVAQPEHDRQEDEHPLRLPAQAGEEHRVLVRGCGCARGRGGPGIRPALSPLPVASLS